MGDLKNYTILIFVLAKKIITAWKYAKGDFIVSLPLLLSPITSYHLYDIFISIKNQNIKKDIQKTTLKNPKKFQSYIKLMVSCNNFK